MREELKDLEMEQVAGGRYYVNGNTKKVAFDTIRGGFQLKNCTVYDAMREMDGLRGTCSSQQEYDQACYNLLKDKGWID